MLSACAEEATFQFVELPESGARYGVFFVLNGSGVVTRVLDPELLPRGETVQMPRSLELEDGEVEVIFAGLSEGELDARVPLLDEARPADLSVRFGAWACEEEDRDYSTLEVHIPVPASAALLRHRIGEAAFSAVTRDTVSFIESTALGFPISYGRCREGLPSELQPFGSLAEQIPPGATIKGLPRDASPDLLRLVAVVRIGDQSVLALGQYTVFLFEKDRPYVDEPSHVLPLPLSYGQPVAIGIDRRSGLDPRPVYVGGGRGQATSAIHVIELSAEGLRLVRTATLGQSPHISDLAVDLRGRVLASDDDGFVWTLQPGDPQIQSERLTRRLEAVALSPDASRPHLLAGTDTALIGDVFAGDLESHAFNELGIGTLELRAVGARRVGVETEVWVAGKSGIVGRTVNGPIEQIQPNWSPDWLPCTSGAGPCGDAAVSHLIDHLEIESRPEGDWIYMRAKECDNAIMAMSERTRCAVELRPPASPSGPAPRIVAIEVHDGWLTAVGDGGRVYEMRLQ